MKIPTRQSALAILAFCASTDCMAAATERTDDQLMLASVCGGFGVLLLLLVFSALREAVAMKRWPVAQGRVVSAAVEKYRELAGAGNFGSTRTRMELYRPVIVYEYAVAGETFKSSRIAQSPGINRGIPDFAEEVVQRYPAGSAVDVRFNPKRPGESVLEPRVPPGWIFVLVIAVALMVLAGRIYFAPA